MKDEQWEKLLAVLKGERLRPVPSGFIIDSPWLPNWAGHTMLDYFASERVFLDSNLRALDTFPETWFLPGFWSEFGMCTEPSAFGATCRFPENEFPFAKPVLRAPEDVDRLEAPDPQKDGLLPLVVQRLKLLQPEIQRRGHKIRFAVARGPLNIASFLMGTTEFLTAIKTDPARMHALLGRITDFLVGWIAYQRACFPTIDGLMMLDDLVGFVGRRDFVEFALPYLKRLFALDVSVRLFHNDAPCRVAAPFLPEIGVNLLNFGIQHSLAEMKEWTQGEVALLGNVPPRDVLAQGTPGEVRACVVQQLESVADHSRLIVSCGGGMPPGASTENVRTLIETVKEHTR